METGSRRTARAGWLAGFALLGIGVAIGLLLRPAAWDAAGADAPSVAASQPAGPFRRDAGVPRAESDLPTLELELAPQAVRTLQDARERAVRRGQIVQDAAEIVPATVRVAGRKARARVRLKGDLTDHVESDKWSLRVELQDDRLFGMSRFSIQHPKVRNYLWEWLVLAAARREGALAPRALFVDVVINGRPSGVYYLEEHPTPELLEAQGRREGPIVRFLEETFWSLAAQSTLERPGEPPRTGLNPLHTAEIEAFGEGRAAQIDALNRQLLSALDKLRRVQLGLVAATLADHEDRFHVDDSRLLGRTRAGERWATMRRVGEASWPARVAAAAAVADDAVDDLFDVRSAARVYALLSLFGGRHGVQWHNMRFYHDPVRERLELLVSDTGSQREGPDVMDPLMWSETQICLLLNRSPGFYVTAFRDLARYTDPAWLDGLAADLGPELERYERALAAEGLLPETHTVAEMWNTLRYRQLHLAGVLDQPDPIGFLAYLEAEDDPARLMSGTIEVEAWATTRVPVVLEGFRFSNGRFQPAAAVAVEAGAPALREGGGVILPWDGRRLRFRFPVDDRLSTLNEVHQVTDAAKQRTVRDQSVRERVDALYRIAGREARRVEQLKLRRFRFDWLDADGRPSAPSVVETLERHPFLEFDLDAGELRVLPGAWTVAGDLVVPDGYRLAAGPGTELRFAPGAGLIAGGALRFEGAQDHPVVLGPAQEGGSWAGVAVLDSAEKCVWTRVDVHGTDVFERGGWILTGGVTFYRTPVELRACRFFDARGEDALNVFGAEVLLDRCGFERTASDAFDGDFVGATVRGCVFEHTAGDALDFSGSRGVVEDSTFRDIGDKALSAGEQTHLAVRGCKAFDVAIGIASKDDSRVEAEDLVIERARHYALAAYVKKPEFGPSTIEVTGLSASAPGMGVSIAQTGCTLRIDGQDQPTASLDVERLYADGILGR